MSRFGNFYISVIVAGAVFFTTLLLGATRFSDYAPESFFLDARLALHLNQGHGLVYNPGDTTLHNLSPMYAVILSLDTTHPQALSAAINFLAYSLSGAAIYILLKRCGLSTSEAIFSILIWVLCYPVWIAFHTAQGIVLLLITTGWLLIQNNQSRLGGLVIGLAPLFLVSSIIAVLILGIHSFSRANNWRFWQTVWMPYLAWIAVASITYQNVVVSPSIPKAQFIDLLWIVIFFVSAVSLYRVYSHFVLWFFFTWGITDLCLYIIFNQQISQVNSTGIALSVAISTAVSSRLIPYRWRLLYRILILVIFTSLLLFVPPTTPGRMQTDRNIRSRIEIPPNSSIAHDRSAALTFDLPVTVYHLLELDSQNNPESHIISLAPDYILISPTTQWHEMDFTHPGINALNYVLIDRHEAYQLWHRESHVGQFSEVHALNLPVRQDIQIMGFASDQSRVNAGEVVRIRVDWQLDYPPEESIGLNLSLIDIKGQSISQVIEAHPQAMWKPLSISTYHAFSIPQQTSTGIYRVDVTVEYSAGIVGNQTIGEIVVPPPVTIVDPDNIIGMLGDIILYTTHLESSNDQLIVNLLWGAQNPIEKDYTVFVHLAPIDSPIPVSQSDSPPMNGRYPTSYWQSEDVISETRILPLSGIHEGTYRLSVGLYDNQNIRLSGESGDSLVIGQIIIDADRVIEIIEQE